MEIAIRRSRPGETNLLCILDEKIFTEEDAFTTPDSWKGLKTFFILVDGSIVGSIALRHNTDVSEKSFKDDYVDRPGSLYIVVSV